MGWRRSLGRQMVAAAAVAWSAFGQTSADLPELQVVDTPVVEKSEATPYGGWVTTVTRAQIEDLNAMDLTSALRRTPGVTISRYNRVGSFGGGNGGGVFIRGLGSSRPGGEILTLIDGIPVFNPVWNHPLLDLDPVDAAGAIDVFKGPHPAVFGNAFSAVNLVPVEPVGDGLQTRLRLAYGSDSTWVQALDHSGKEGMLDWAAGGSHRSSDGHRAESDGRMGEFRLRLGAQLDEHWYASAYVLRTDNQATDPGPRGNPAAREGVYETRSWLGAIKLAHDFECVQGDWLVYFSRGHGDWYNQAGAAKDTLNDWTTSGVRWREDITVWPQGVLRLGWDHDRQLGEALFTTDAGGRATFDETRLYLNSPYAAFHQTIGDPEGLHAIPSVGVRWYDHSVFDSEAAPHAGLVVARGGTRLHAAYARGVSYPGLNVIAFSQNVIPALGAGWEELDAERVEHLEAGLTQDVGKRAEASLTLFRDSARDRYVFFRRGAGGPPNTWANIEHGRIHGAEAAVTVRPLDDLSLFAGLTYLDAEPNDLPYTPQWTAAAGLTAQLHERLRWTLDAQYVDDMPVLSQARLLNAVNTRSVDSYILVNTKVSLDVGTSRLVRNTVFVAVENLTDTDYEYLPGYPMPGIGFMAGLEVRF